MAIMATDYLIGNDYSVKNNGNFIYFYFVYS